MAQVADVEYTKNRVVERAREYARIIVAIWYAAFLAVFRGTRADIRWVIQHQMTVDGIADLQT
jgi:hypothetical protein